jgi:hypothetical protein
MRPIEILEAVQSLVAVVILASIWGLLLLGLGAGAAFQPGMPMPSCVPFRTGAPNQLCQKPHVERGP